MNFSKSASAAVSLAGLFTLLSAGAPAAASAPEHGGVPLVAMLDGASEVGGGDADGTGLAVMTVNPGQGEICYALTVALLDGTIAAAHIHRAPAGVNGPIVVPLAAPVGGASAACTAVNTDLAHEIVQDPAGFYVNVHTSVFPAGAVRGQLHH